MNQLKEVVNAVLEQQKLQLAPSTYDARKNYLNHLVEYGDHLGIPVPCQELYDAYVSRAATPDLRFQLLHAVRLVDKEAGTKALTPEGKLYNEPKLPSSSESEKIFQNISFPVSDRRIDTGHLIRRAESEIIYLHLSASTRWQYMQAWRELYTFLYLSGSTVFTRESCNAFVEDTTQKHQEAPCMNGKEKSDAVPSVYCLKWRIPAVFNGNCFFPRKHVALMIPWKNSANSILLFCKPETTKRKPLLFTTMLSDLSSKEQEFLMLTDWANCSLHRFSLCLSFCQNGFV